MSYYRKIEKRIDGMKKLLLKHSVEHPETNFEMSFRTSSDLFIRKQSSFFPISNLVLLIY